MKTIIKVILTISLVGAVVGGLVWKYHHQNHYVKPMFRR